MNNDVTQAINPRNPRAVVVRPPPASPPGVHRANSRGTEYQQRLSLGERHVGAYREH